MIHLGANVTETYATLEDGNTPAVGNIVELPSGNKYIFVRYGANGATANFAVSITHAGAAVMTTNAASLFGERVGVAMATAAANEYGWAQIYGAVSVQTDVALVNTRLQTTTTAGQLDDAAGAGTKQIVGITLTTARTGSAGLAPAFLNWPVIGATN
jgi:hypothetical protein